MVRKVRFTHKDQGDQLTVTSPLAAEKAAIIGNPPTSLLAFSNPWA